MEALVGGPEVAVKGLGEGEVVGVVGGALVESGGELEGSVVEVVGLVEFNFQGHQLIEQFEGSINGQFTFLHITMKCISNFSEHEVRSYHSSPRASPQLKCRYG